MYPLSDKKFPLFDVALLPPPGLDSPPVLQAFVGNPGNEVEGGRIPPDSQEFTHFPHQKNPS